MKLCKPSFEILEQSAGLEGVYKQIERVGRVCYKSEDKITENSAKPFVDRMIKSNHGAILEHGTVYLAIPVYSASDAPHDIVYNKYTQGKRVYTHGHEGFDAITTNYRVLVENNWLNLLQYRCEPTDYHEKRVTVHFICDIGVGREFTRHRTMSMAQESTRYCNYSKDKFNKEVTFIIPSWCGTPFEVNGDEVEFMNALKNAQEYYLSLLKMGWSPQQARNVLPLATKSELVLTGFVSQWQHFFDLRAKGITGAPHPQAKELAEPLMKEFIRRELL